MPASFFMKLVNKKEYNIDHYTLDRFERSLKSIPKEKKNMRSFNESMPTQKEVSSNMSGDSVFRSGLYSVSENKIKVMLTQLQITQTRTDRR